MISRLLAIMSIRRALALAARWCSGRDSARPASSGDVLLRAALEEWIRMGPESRSSAAERLRARAPDASDGERELALVEAKRATVAAESFAREYQDGRRSQASIAEELRRLFPWLGPSGRGSGDLADRLSSFGYYLVIM